MNGQRVPYPNAEWNRWDSLQVPNRFVNVQAGVIDATDALWVLDPANPEDADPVIAGIKLLKINLNTNKVERIYRFEDLPRERSGLTDSPNQAIRYITPAGHLETLAQDSRLSWPDTFAVGPDGYLYLTSPR